MSMCVYLRVWRQVCRREVEARREVGRLAWSSRSCVKIDAIDLHVDLHVDELLHKLVVTKNIGLALRRFQLDGYDCDRIPLSLAALAQHCPNLEHLDLRSEVYTVFKNRYRISLQGNRKTANRNDCLTKQMISYFAL